MCQKLFISHKEIRYQKSLTLFSSIQDEVCIGLWFSKCNCCSHCRVHWRFFRSDIEHFEHLCHIEVQKVEEQCNCTLAVCLGFQWHYILSDAYPYGTSILQKRTIPRRIIFVLLHPYWLQVNSIRAEHWVSKNTNQTIPITASQRNNLYTLAHLQ